ncbi:MAG: DUF3108 domain-containing protein [Cytophagales bacterium]
MKKSFKISLVLLVFVLCSFAVHQNLPSNEPLSNKAFVTGEKLEYRVHYGFINAGRAEVEISNKIVKVNERPCYKISAFGRTVGSLDMFTKIRNYYGSYIDTATLVPYKHYRNVKEGNYKLNEEVFFDHKEHKALRKVEGHGDESYDIPGNAQDIISGFYYLRNMDLDNLKKGDTIKVLGFFENQSFDFKMKYLGKEKVKTDFGQISSHMISPIMPPNALFVGENSLKVWISDDRNRVPLKCKASTYVGAIEMELVGHSGLKSKLGEGK